jgi:hypothetical protein
MTLLIMYFFPEQTLLSSLQCCECERDYVKTFSYRMKPVDRQQRCVKCRSVFCCRRMLFLVLVMVAPLMAANLTKPPLVMKHQMCSDLCTSGLGGTACGELCSDDLVLELQFGLKQYTAALPRQKPIYGPRRSICPQLCRSNLGHPLCDCHVNR